MHVAMIAPPWIPIPPTGYGGIERVIYDLVEGLAALGHEVTLFAPDGSKTSGNLVPVVHLPVGLDLPESEKFTINQTAAERAYAITSTMDVDVIHDHTDFLYRGPLSAPVVRTIHGPVTDEHLLKYEEMSLYGDQFIAISGRQRELFEQAAMGQFGNREALSFLGVVHNPVDVASFRFFDSDEKEDYVAYLGRCHWEKGPSFAIQVARDAGVKLKMGMRVSRQEEPYFVSVVKPLIEEYPDLIEFVGEVGGSTKSELIGHARAMLFTSTWEEPFGLVMVESLAHGTPVAALNRGSAPEVIDHGLTGMLSPTWTKMAESVSATMSLEPQACRNSALSLFDRSKIASLQVDLYETAIAMHQSRKPLAVPEPVADRFVELDGGAPPQLIEQPMRETPSGWLQDGVLVGTSSLEDPSGSDADSNAA